MRILAAIGALAIIVAIGAAVFFLGGFYNVAGTEDDPGIVKWALIKVRMASINRHADELAAGHLQRSRQYASRARAFAENGGANCHGAPGVNWAKFSEGLRPDPPDLKETVNDRTPSQLFWVIKNGINMTGMPSFGLAGTKDEDIWSLVAFLKKLPSISEAEYKAWTAPAPGASTPPTQNQ